MPRPTLRVSAARVVGVVKTAAPPVGRGVLQIGTLLWQLLSTAAVLSATSFVVLLGAGYADGIGTLLLCLLFALVAAGVGTVFGVIVGLPLRLSRRARGWWIRNGELAFVGVAVGLLGMVAAFAVGGSSGPIGGLLIPGWLVFAASLANTWWPNRWRPARFRSVRPRRAEAASRAAESGATGSGAGTRGNGRRGAKASYEEFLAASGRAFRGERD
ncbi:hypothetical protein [Agreia sp. COWG]|uniref:hypothetical protein n=1 Tax=Agreia sp. COWG TaxID=2773266 RepID=UPI001928DA4C|nr:hypothetical protein [Agreia sp. COWG]